MEIERNRPFGPLRAGRTFILPVERINPLIRIAHRLTAPLRISERIIFDHELVLITEGQGVVRSREGEMTFAAGTLFFIPPFWPHAIESAPGKRCEHLAVHYDFRADVPPRGKDPGRRSPYRVRLAGGSSIPPAHRCRPHDEIYTALVTLVQARSRGDDPISSIEQRGHLLRVIAKLLQVPAPTNHQPMADRRNAARIDRAIAHMRGNLTGAFDAEELAEVAGLSPSHFTRLFREHTGYTPMQFLRHCRIDAARALLGDVDLSVKEIAARCGFDDPYHFSKVFHQIDGLPPTEYREAVLAGRR